MRSLKNIFFVCRKNKLLQTGSLFFPGKLKGGALYIAIMVSGVIGILLSLFILIARYNQRTITTFTQTAQLYYNLQSAFQIAQSEYFTADKNDAWLKNTIGDDSIKIKKQPWGAYLLITAVTKNRHQHLSQGGLYGIAMSGDTGLVVAENGRQVALSGAVSLKANCYLPKAGIKPAYIEGQSYVASAQNSGFIKASPYSIPVVSEAFIDAVKDQQYGANAYIDSLVTALPVHCSRPFTSRTIAWKTSAGQLSELNLSDNIKIDCANVSVDSSCHLKNTLLICRKIRFKKGFKGAVHVIASDSIICEDGSQFSYPSSFVLLPDDESDHALRYIQLGKDCSFTGAMLALHGSTGDAQKVFIKLHAGSEVNGFIYSADYLHLEGTVNATAICNRLLLKTPSAVYENHALGCTVDPKKYAQLLAVPQVFKNRSKLICIAKTS